MSYSVKLQHVTKRYKMHSKNSDKLKNLLSPGSYGEDFYAIKRVDFEAYRGDVVGIIGINGSGKSTVSNLIAGVTAPTSGKVSVMGEVSLIAVSAGLNKELTGRENIELKCLMMGIGKEDIERLKPDIIEFADIGKFIDMPVKKYSSGMKSRLGFAISVSVDPDVLIIDEALSVGDQTFADKCFHKLNEFKEQGKTIFFVSHSAAQVKRFCTKALWLEHGEVKDQGTVQEVLPKYTEFITEYKKKSKKEQKQFKQEGMRKQSENKVDYSEQYFPSRATSMKKPHSIKKVADFLALLLMVTLIVLTYVNKQEISAAVNNATNEFRKDPGSVTSEGEGEVSSEAEDDIEDNNDSVNPLEELDLRYVDTPVARVRDKPNLDSKELALVQFGYPFIVKDTVYTEGGETSWLKTTADDGEDIWISESISQKVSFSQALEDDVLIGSIKKLADSTSSFDEALEILGASKVEIDNRLGDPIDQDIESESAFLNYGDLRVYYNLKFVASQVKVSGFSFTVSSMEEELGKPHLQDEFSSLFLYRSDACDYLFHSSNGFIIDQITIISPLDLN